MLAEGLPPAFGGAARQALMLAGQLRDGGARIFFASAQNVPGSPPLDTLQGFTVYRVPHVDSGKWIRLQKLLGYCALLWRKRHEFEILHVHGPYYLTLAAAFFARTVLRKKVLLKLTLIDFDTPSAIKSGRYGRLAWFFYRQADAFACMSHRLQTECEKHELPVKRLHYTPNGVDAQRFHPAHSLVERNKLRDKLEIPRDCWCGVIIGMVEARKGIDLLVEVADKLHSSGHNVRFLVVGPDGSGPGEHLMDMTFVRTIRERIEAKGLRNRVLLLGRRNNTAEYLRAADFFIFTSRSEGFGTALIEAMASGLPTVALNIPGVTTDIITHGRDGIIIEQEDPGAFAAAILRLLSEPEYARSMGAAARATVQARFDFPAVARRYAELYDQLLTGKATPSDR